MITVDPGVPNALKSQDPPSPEASERFPYLSHEDAVMWTAATGQVELLKSLLRNTQCALTHAMILAASYGHFDAVMELLHQLKCPNSEYLSCNGYQILKKAVILATKKGHYAVVVTLLKWLQVDGEIDKDTAWKVLDEAASNGHLELVKFVAMYVIRDKDDEKRCSDSKAVSLAITGGCADAVMYLLRYPWNLAYSFLEAVEKEQHVVAMRIYMAYPQYYGGTNLFTEMAGDGFATAVKYMYECGYSDAELIQNAFVKAAVARRTNVVEFLLTTGRVSMEGFERSLQAAASSGSIAAVTYLCSKQLASLKGIHRAFEMSGSLSVTQFLYKKVNIPDASITTALKNVSGIGTMIPMQKKEREAIALFLCKKTGIPPDVICTVFAMTAYDMPGMVEALYNNPCISREVICAALQQLPIPATSISSKV